MSHLSDQPKPIGEWTADDGYVGASQGSYNVESSKVAEQIASAHNAALAAQRDRDFTEHVWKFSDDWTDGAIRALEKQLDAEREKHESVLLSYITTHQADVIYNEQLREKVQKLVNALKAVRAHLLIGDDYGKDIIDRALAKVKEVS